MTNHRDDLLDTLCRSLDGVVAACEVEPDERQAFATAAQEFMATYRDELEARDLDWPVLPALVAAEQLFILRGDMTDVDRLAALTTIRQYVTWAQSESARMN